MPRVSSERLTVGLLFVAIGVLACLAPVQSDTWWHLRGGRDLFETGRIPLEDTYSHTAAGAPWPNHEWLTQALFYALFRVGGLPLLQVVVAAAITASVAVSWRLASGSFEARVTLFAAAVVASAPAWAVRPQAFSLLLFALTCAFIAANRWLWLPLLFVIWTNLHGAVALGVVAVMAGVAGTAIAERRLRPRLLAIAAACVLATGLSPLGFGLWIEIWRSIERSRVNALIEWQPPGLDASTLLFWAIAGVLAISLLWRWRTLDTRAWRLFAIALSVLPLALRAVRNIAVFLLVAVPALSAALPQPARVRRRPPTSERTGVNGVLLCGAGVAAAVLVALVWLRPPEALGWRPISDAARQAIASCEGRLYNTYAQGGVLIWFVPEVKVFLDNRQDPYSAALLTESRRVELGADFRPLFEQYGITCAVQPPASPIAIALRTEPGWTLRYEDARWTLFSRIARAAPGAAR